MIIFNVFPNRIYYAFQLAFRGYSDFDSVDIPFAFNKRLLGALKLHKENLSGYPADLTEEKWNDILNDIIFYFEVQCGQHNDLDDIVKWHPKERPEEVYKYRRGKYYFYKYYDSLWN